MAFIIHHITMHKTTETQNTSTIGIIEITRMVNETQHIEPLPQEEILPTTANNQTTTQAEGLRQ